MKLLNSEGEVLVTSLNEKTTILRLVKGEPILIYYVTEMDHGEAKKYQIGMLKVEDFEGSLVLDDGKTKIDLKGKALGDKVDLLAKYLGKLTGIGSGMAISEAEIEKAYKAIDTKDKSSVNVTIWVNGPEGYDGEESIKKNFIRGGENVTVADLLKFAPKVEGYSIIGVAPGKNLEAKEKDSLGFDDVLFTDQEVTFVWGKLLTIDVNRNLVENDEEKISVKVPYDASISNAIEIILASSEVKAILSSEEAKGREIVGVTKADGGVFSNKLLKKAAANYEDGFALSWSEGETASEPTVEYREVTAEEVAAGVVSGTTYYTKNGDEYVVAENLEAFADGTTYYVVK